MAGTTLADIITPACAPVSETLFKGYLINCGEGSLWGSSLVKEDMRATDTAMGNSLTQAHPFYERQDNSIDMNVLDLNVQDCPDACGIRQQAMTMRKFSGSKLYREEYSATFLMACSQDDPLKVIMDDVVSYDWMRIYTGIVMSMLRGLYEHVRTNFPGEQDYDATTAEAIQAGGTSSLNNVHVNFAKNLFACDQLGGLITHQQQATTMENLGLLSCPCIDDQGSRVFEMQDGTSTTVIRDPAIKPFLELADGKFLNILYRTGAILYGEGCHPKPMTLDEEECANNGDGALTLYTRRRFSLHPDGFSFSGLDGTGGGFNALVPTNAELQNPNVYERVVPVDFQPFVFIVSEA